MKSRAVILTLLLGVQTVFADVLPPQWSEFAPPEMVNAQVGALRKPSQLLLIPACIPGINLIALPFIVSQTKQYRADENRNYWATRRIAFENEIQACQGSMSDKAMCYLQVRQLEEQKSASRQAHLDQVRLQRIQYIQHSRTTNLNCNTYGNHTSCTGY